MPTLKIYVDTSLPQPDQRKYLSEIIRPFWNTRTLTENLAIYGDFPDHLELVDDLASADVGLLPMTWRYYQEHQRILHALDFARQVTAAGKPLAVFAMGDYKAHVPLTDAVIFGCSLYRSRIKQPTFAVASFFPDLIAQELGGEFTLRPKKDLPTVGFCGQASLPAALLGREWLKNGVMRVLDGVGRLPYEAPPLEPHILLRARALDALRRSPHVETNFIIRDRYWGGVGDQSTRGTSDIRRAYLENLIGSDYIVCVRGAGNFSKRLYETLCCGRIPVFVNTDCVLPFEFAADWRQYCVWVEADDLHAIGDKVAAFHARLSPAAFNELQAQCRRFWREWLTLAAFYAHFHRHFTPDSVARGLYGML